VVAAIGYTLSCEEFAAPDLPEIRMHPRIVAEAAANELR
jgi:hypothetical protein